MADSVWACMSKSRNTEDQRRVLKEKTSPRLIAPSHLAGRIPLAKDRGRHYFGRHLSTKMADSVWACMSKSRTTEDQRRVLKEKTSPRLIAPSNFPGRIPLAKDRARHYCIGTHLFTKMADSVENRVVPAAGKDRGRHYCIGTPRSTKMADSVENRVVPAVPIPSTLLQLGRTNTAGKR